MKDKITKLYFVALVPPPDVLQKVKKLKEEVAERFESKAALRSPPHITLHMPFKFREDREERIEQVLRDVSKDQAPIRITQEGFGAFAPRVIFVNVEKTDPLETMRANLVQAMRRGLNLENADYKNRPFNPHMTIAFRDLKKRLFNPAWESFRDRKFEENWPCKELILLKHNGHHWEVYRQIPLSGSS
jgi:2'-5' RNA ligase